MEEPGTVTLTSLTENIQARVEVTAVLEDPDIAADVTWQWSRSPNGRTDWVNIAGATSAAYTPTLEADTGSYIRATASYNDGHGTARDTAQAVSARVGDPPPVNSAPAFPATEDGQREAPEDTAGGDPIGEPVAATDVNAGDSSVNDPLAYSLTGTDAASFEIDPGSGQIRLVADVQLDYEGKRTYRLTARVTDGRDQNGDDDMDAIDDTINVTITVTDVNEAPEVSGDSTPSYEENSSSAVATYSATDPERDTITWTVGNDFWVSQRGQLYFRSPPSFEDQTSYQATVEATDEDGLSDSIAVTVTVTDIEEAGSVKLSPPRGWLDQQTPFSAVLADDDGQIMSTTWQWARSSNRSSWTDVPGATFDTYAVGQGNVEEYNHYLRATASYSDRRGSNKTASGVLPGRIGDLVPATNAQPQFAEDSVTRSVSQGTAAGRAIGAPVQAVDPDGGDILSYSLNGPDADDFDIDTVTGQLRTRAVLDRGVKDTYEVTVSVHDGFSANYSPSDVADDMIQVVIAVTEVSRGTPSGGSGGGASGGSASSAPGFSGGEEACQVMHRIADLDRDNGMPMGIWGDGATLWVLNNTETGPGAVFAYDLALGDRKPQLEFTLHADNDDPQGIWSDGATVWVSDSNQDMLYAYDLATGEWVEDESIALAEDNGSARGIWADGARLFVVDDFANALFAYELESGKQVAEHALDELNANPRGITSDVTSIWVSDGSARRVFSYRLEEDNLVRVLSEELAALGPAGNNDSWGIWSYGNLMYVVDSEDGRIYPYALPIAIDARLAMLDLEGLDIGEFACEKTEYVSVRPTGKTETTVAGKTARPGATVVIQPEDADGDPNNGHQVTLADDTQVTVTVTSADGSRILVYLVRIVTPEQLPEFADGAAAIRTVDENTVAGENIGRPVQASGRMLTYALTGDDAGSFEIVAATGQLKTRDLLDYEEKSEYGVTVTATTESGRTASIPVAINVINLDEPGMLTLSRSAPVVSVQLAANLSDPDGGVADVSWSWERSDDQTTWTVIDGAADSTYTPVGDDIGHYLRATASYTDAQGPDKRATGESEAPVEEPAVVGPVADLVASVDGQGPNSVRLTWAGAENAQTHMVAFIKSSDVAAGEYHRVRFMPFSGSQGVIAGLEGGAEYLFIAIGMRWNWIEYGTVWGNWSSWATATPKTGGLHVEPDYPDDEPQFVGPTTGLAVSALGQEPGTVRAIWTSAENAQVHFVVYIKSADIASRNYGTARVAPFAGSEGVIGGLESGVPYHFIAIGMRWNWIDYGTVWGSWSDWVETTP